MGKEKSVGMGSFLAELFRFGVYKWNQGRLARQVTGSILGVTFLFSIGSIYLAKKAHQLRTTTGMEGLLGEVGVVKESLNPEGRVLVHGETWNAKSDVAISDGEKVIVEAVEGLKIKVRKVGE